jgi:hypothetical protein
MLQNLLHQELTCLAKLGGLVPSYWSAINLNSNDRRLEGIIGVQEIKYS